MWISQRGALLGAIGAFLVSCTSTTPVAGSADDMVFPVIRAEVDFTGRVQAGDEPRPRRGRGRGFFGMELAVSGAQDEFQPTGGFTQADFRIVDTHVAFRGGGEVDGRFRLEALTGIEFSNFKLETSRASQARDSDVSNNFGPFLGAQLTFDVVPDYLSIFGRATAAYAPDTESRKFEAGLRFAASEATHLLLAYREWEYEDDGLSINSTRVGLDLEMTGIVLGLVTRF